MDELIQILVQLLIDLFRGRQPPAGPGFPNLPPRPPAAPPPVPQGPATRIPLPPPDLGKPAQRSGPQRQRQPVRTGPGRGRQPAPVVARPPVAPVQTVQASLSAPPPPPPMVKRPAPAVDAAVIRRWLRPGTLRSQYILTEIFQPPLALRDSVSRDL
jgi:hypothetical protein